MKKLFLVIVFLVPIQMFSQNWSSQTSGTTAALYDVYFVNSNDGWVVGDMGTILRTANGGSSWSAQTSGVSDWLSEVWFYDANTGYAIGQAGTILKTTNGGSGWTKLTISSTADFHCIHFFDANYGFICGSNGEFWKTTNGGSSWTSISTGTTAQLNSIFFNNSIIGTIVGDNGTILRTTNGGTSWAVQVSGVNLRLLYVHFYDLNNGGAVGFNGTILHTTNAGATWTSQTGGTTANLRGVWFTSLDNGVIIGDNGTSLKSTNGGSSWTSLTSGTSNNLWSLWFSSSTSGYAVGAGGTILKYSGAPPSNWTVYTSTDFGIPGNKVKKITIDASNIKWLVTGGTTSTDGGVVKYDGSTWTPYTKTAMGFTSTTTLNCITTDNFGAIKTSLQNINGSTRTWVGTENGLARYMSGGWTKYTTSNGLPNNQINDAVVCAFGVVRMGAMDKLVRYSSSFLTYSTAAVTWIMCLLVDAAGTEWIGTSGEGLYSFNGSTWTPRSSPFTSQVINCMAWGGSGIIWAGDEQSGKIGKFNGSTWTSYTCPVGTGVRGIAVEGSGVLQKNVKGPSALSNDQTNLANVVWVATDAGLLKFDGTNWTTYTTANTNGGLPSNSINCVIIDGNNKKWVGTDAGLAVLDDGVVNLPAISVSASTVNYGTVNVNSTKDSTITISNTGTATLVISQTTLSGTDATSYQISSGNVSASSPVNVSPGGNYNLTVKFLPTSGGSKTASLQITHNASGSPSNVTLSGTGAAPAISISPSALNFGNVYVGTNSDAPLAVNNPGNAALTVSGIAILGTDATFFKCMSHPDSNSLPITISAGGSTNLSVRFSPISPGDRSASIRITNNAGNPVDITLSGKGFGIPVASLSTTSLSFGSISVNSSKSMTIYVENQGSDTLSVSKVVFGGIDTSMFTCTDVFPMKIAPMQGSTKFGKNITINFSPTSPGSKTANIQITHNAGGSPNTISLSGSGSAAGVVINTNKVDFGGTLTNDSKTSSLVIRNSGLTVLRIDSLNIVGVNKNSFTVVGQSLPINLNASDSVTVSVKFTPLAAGIANAILRIVSNDAVNPLIEVALSGQAGKPDLFVSDTIVSFGNINVNDTTSKSIQISNLSAMFPLRIDSMYFEQNQVNIFSLDKVTYPLNISISGKMSRRIYFKPLLKAIYTMNLVIISSDYTMSPFKLKVQGSGVAPDIAFKPDSINFGNVPFEEWRDTAIVFKNNGNSDLIVSDIKIVTTDEGLSFKSFTPGNKIASGGNDSIIVRYFSSTPSTAVRKFDLQFTTNIYNKKMVVFPVKARSVFPAIETDTVLKFAKIKIQTSKNIDLMIVNFGGSYLKIANIQVAGKDSSEFSLPNQNYPIIIYPTQMKTIPVTFAPKTAGNKSAYLKISSNDQKYPTLLVNLYGESIQQNLTSNISSVDFGKISISFSKDTNIILQNQGTDAITVNSLVINGTDAKQFSLPGYSNTSFNLNAGETKSITIRYSPDINGIKSASLDITSTDQFNPKISVPLSGEGLSSKLTLSSIPAFTGTPKEAELQSVPANCLCVSSISVKITNSGAGKLKIDSINLFGEAEFKLSKSNFNPVLDAGKADSFSIVYTSGTPYGLKRATVVIKSNDISTPLDSVQLKILVTKPLIEVSSKSIDLGKSVVRKTKDYKFTIKNKGDYSLTVSKIYISTSDSADFKVLTSDFQTPGSMTIKQNDSLSLYARFEPVGTGKKSSKIIIENSDYQSKANDITLSGEGVIPDLALGSNAIANLNESKQIAFSLDNINLPTDVKVFYKYGGETKFDSSQSLVPSSTSPVLKYDFNVPAEKVTLKGLDYYIKVSWDKGVQSILPKTDYAKYPLTHQIRIKSYTANFTLPLFKYTMLTVPFQFEGTGLIQQLISNLGPVNNSKWRLIRWRNNNYEEFLNEKEWNIACGESFWIVTRENAGLTLSDLITNPTNIEYGVKLAPGWNQIGNPFLFDASFAGLVVPNGKKVEKALFGWDESENYYLENNKLKQWTGYFIKNNETDTVNVLISPIAYQAAFNKTLAKNEWKISLEAKTDNRTNNMAEIGCLLESKDTWDPNDISEPPRTSNKYLSVKFPHDEWSENSGAYIRDYRSISSNGSIWEMEINKTNWNTPENSGNGKLYLTLSGTIPENYLVYIYDYDNNSRVICPFTLSGTDLKSVYDFSFISDRENKKLRIIIGTKEFADNEGKIQKLEVKKYSLNQNFPNPFNPSTRIEYTIPERSFIILKVYNCLGQLIETVIEQEQTEGRYTIDWKPVDLPSGIYYYRLETGKYTEIRKMLFLR